MSARERPIFVVGCPRSGTTLLQVMLHAHPRIAVPPENRYVLPAYYRRGEWGDLRAEANRRKLASFVTGPGSRFRDFGLSRRRVRTRIAAAPPTLGSALEIVMREYAAAAGKARWCDKRPLYIAHVAPLRRMFPDAQFIHLIRDGRATTASLLRMPWWQGDFDKALGAWLYAMRAGRRWRRRLPADTWLELRYERLVADPEPELRALCRFLGEEFDPAMLTPRDAAAAVVPARKVWHANTGGPLLGARAEAWRDELAPADLAVMDAVAGRTLRALGYPLAAVGVRPPAARVARFVFREGVRRARLRARALADAATARREPPVASAFAAPTRPPRP